MKPPLVADTGGLLRALAANSNGQPAWPDFADALAAASAVIVPVMVLPEVDYFLRHERQAMRKLVAELLDPATTYELEPLLAADLVRAMVIDTKFKELNLGLVEGAVAAVAERRHVFRVLTTDRAHFSVIRVGPTFRQALTLLP